MSKTTPAAPNAGLRALLAPRSVAVIGASRRADTMGHQILRNLIEHGFTGAVYPVNPNAASVASVHAYPSVAALPGPVDLGVIVVPHPQVLEVAAGCCEAGVKGLIVISAGFREVGGAGEERERALAALVRSHGVRMVGPNCMGIVNADPAISMNATFATVMPPFGPSAFVSQSGALGLNVLDHAREFGIGISQFVSVGNKPDVSGNDLLLEWEHDPAVRVILMYVESFGNPRNFLRIASRITKTKPIVVVKAGRSQAGARAASSHTGALAASDALVEAMLAQAGVLRAGSVEELFDIAMAFGARALPRSRRTAVLTNAGGPGILAADALDAAELTLPDLSPATLEALRSLYPAEASVRNPLDMVASARPPGYVAALSALLADPVIDAVVPIFVPPFGVLQRDVADAIVTGAAATPDKPVLAVLMGRVGLQEGRAALHRAGIPAYAFPESAARALRALNRQVEWAAKAPPAPERIDADMPGARRIIAGARAEGRTHLTELEALDLLAAYGIPVAAARLVERPEDLAAAGAAVGWPLVMKIVSPDVIHKTDAGGVVVGVGTPAKAADAFERIVRSVKERVPNARITGVLVQRLVAQGRETIVGVARDESFGPLVMFGLGGVFVEAMRDVVFRMAPLDAVQAHEMLRAIRAASVLDGVRGEGPVDKDALARVIRAVAQLADDLPEVVELDVNPLVAAGNGVIAVDARVRLAAPPG
jgi:acetyltransferase